MTRPAPVVWLPRRTQRTCRTLRQELSDERVRTVILEGLLGRAELERDQALRDCDLLAAGWRKPSDARAFLRTARAVDEAFDGTEG